MIVARLEIDSSGHVRVAAPNAIIDPAGTTENERADLRARLDAGLAQSWPSVAPLPLEFDGRVFHKPGGVAPQLEWDGAEKRMTMVFYSGNRTAIRVKLDPMQEYNWPKYAVSRPATKTAAHTRAVAATILTPREETVPAASQAAVSAFRVLWKYQVTITPTTTSENFHRNMPSARYFAGFDDHSVKPL